MKLRGKWIPQYIFWKFWIFWNLYFFENFDFLKILKILISLKIWKFLKIWNFANSEFLELWLELNSNNGSWRTKETNVPSWRRRKWSIPKPSMRKAKSFWWISIFISLSLNFQWRSWKQNQDIASTKTLQSACTSRST